MKRLKKEEAEIILQNYLDSLDNGKDDFILLDELKKATQVNYDFIDFYQDALFAQQMYYRRIAQVRLPGAMQRFQRIVDQHIAIPQETIWSYLALLLKQKMLTWKDILKQLGKSEAIANRLSSGNWTVKVFNPSEWAIVAKQLEVEPILFLNLIYRALNQGNDNSNCTLSFRSTQENDGAASIISKSCKTDEELLFINEIERYLLQ